MKFKPHQEFAFDWLQSRPRAILSLEQRLGKTAVALRDVKRATNVICPAFLKLQWLEEIRTWRPDLRPQVIYPDTKADKSANVFIVNYDILQDCYLAALPNLIVDEGHYCTGWESKRTLTTLALAERAETVRWLTGTVIPNRSADAYPVLTALRAIRMDPHSFGVRYCNAYMDAWNQWHYRGDSKTDELQRIMSPYLLRITREQAGMPENEWKVIALDLPVDARERNYDLDAIARNPAPLGMEGLAGLIHFQAQAKLPQCLAYVKNLLAQNEGPLLVFAWHRDIIEELARALTAANRRVGVIVGGMPEKERKGYIDAFARGELDVLLGNRKAAGVGLPLHIAERVVFVEAGWSPGENGQAADRGVSMERPRSLRVDLLVVNKSIDEFMVRRCLEKEGTIDRLVKPNEEFSTWLSQRTPDLHPSRLLLRPFQPWQAL